MWYLCEVDISTGKWSLKETQQQPVREIKIYYIITNQHVSMIYIRE